MKKFLLFALFAVVSLTLSAQSEVTKFLGIPVDGSKSTMIEKLKTKGFTWNSRMECLEGEFNGEEVYVQVVTNNNKVWRIALVDKMERSEGSIRIRFNSLVVQFERNEKYKHPFLTSEDYIISDDERIGTQISLYDKRYQASYRQVPPVKDTDGMSEEERSEYVQNLLDCYTNNSVWFMIGKGSRYDKYTIIMYYDNERNHAQGDDL